MIARFSLIGMCLCGACLAQTSADNPRLKAALDRYPEADSDKDGIRTLAEDLTLAEMDRFLVDLGWLKQK